MTSPHIVLAQREPQQPPPSNTGARRLILAGCVLVLLLALSILLSFAIGAKSIHPFEVAAALLGTGDSDVLAIVGQLRMSRTLVGLACGCALGLAGVLMQAITRNPIADPGILGVNAGAALGVVTGIMITGTLGVQSTMVFAMLGAGLASAAVLLLSSAYAGSASPVRLTLSGVALAAILSGITHALILSDESILDTFRFWQVGSLAARPFNEAAALVPMIALGTLIVLFMGNALNTLALGDDSAVALGSNPARIRLIGLLAMTILCGAATALAGPISFVGLLAPHLVRRFTGPDMRMLIPFSMVAAPVILLLADVLGRVIGRGAEVQVGIVSAFVGAPLLIVLLLGRSSRGIS